MDGNGWRTLVLGDVEAISAAGVNWLPLRRELGVEAFGVNAYVANAGELVVEEHTEQSLRHEEVYVVLTGSATFVLDDEVQDAPAGTLVHIPNPHVRRAATATVDGTTVLAAGAPVGETYRPSAWEWSFAAERYRATGDHGAALALLADGLAHHPDAPSLLYARACWEALAGETETALATLALAVQGDPRCAAWAQDDDDFDAIRELPGFPAPPSV